MGGLRLRARVSVSIIGSALMGGLRVRVRVSVSTIGSAPMGDSTRSYPPALGGPL